MKTELILFKFYKSERGEFLFQVINKKIPYIVWGKKYERIGSFLVYDEDLEKNEYEEITKEEFLERMKSYAEDIHYRIDKIEKTSEEEYEEKRQLWRKNYEESIRPFEGSRILLHPENIDEKTIEYICQGGDEKYKKIIRDVFDEFRNSNEKRIEKTVRLTDGRVFNLLYRQ